MKPPCFDIHPLNTRQIPDIKFNCDRVTQLYGPVIVRLVGANLAKP